MKLLALTLKDRGDGLEVSVTYQYEDKLPDKRSRKRFAVEALKTALGALERGEAIEGGFAEQSRQRLRRDNYVVEAS